MDKEKKCPVCGAEMSQHDQYCKRCGYHEQMHTSDDQIKLICPICSQIGGPNDIYCPECGEKLVYRRINELQAPLMVIEPHTEEEEPASVKNELVVRMNHRIRRIIPVIISACFVLVAVRGGYSLWDMFFNRTALDLVSSAEFVYSGETGSGKVKKYTTKVEYDQKNEKLKSFVNSVTYTITPAVNLSNGDTITLKAAYDEDRAKALKLDIVDEQTFKVAGLTKRFANASEIGSKITADLKASASKAIENTLVDEDGMKYGITFDSLWFGKADAKKHDTCMAVYKITSSKSYFYFFKQEKTYYVVEKLNGSLNQAYDTKDSHNWSLEELKNYMGLSVTESSQVQQALEGGYTYSVMASGEEVIREAPTQQEQTYEQTYGY